MTHKKYIVVGINTGVGKTVVAAILTEALNGYYWKPVQCGLPSDKEFVMTQLSRQNRCYPEAFCLKKPCSPHLAAKMEGILIEAKNLIPPSCEAPLIIEGTGGLLSPLNDHESLVDTFIHWNAEWILVHHHYLGSLNHFFLTIEAMKSRNLPLRGIIFNGDGDKETEEMLLKKANTTCLGRLSWKQPLTKTSIQQIAQEWKKTLYTLL